MDTPPAEALQRIRHLVDGFRPNLPALRDPNTSEALTRLEYLDPFWEALGWDVSNRAQRSAAEKDVVIEARVGTVERGRVRSRRSDYLFRIDGFPRFFAEAKKPATDLQTDRDAIFQAKTYAWNAQIPFAVLTDFEEFRLFDATIKPYYDDPLRGLVADFDLRFEDYVPQWDVLYATFSREAVAAGSLERLLARIKRVRAGRRIRGFDRMLFDLRGTEPVDRVFLAHLEDVRLRFARALYAENRPQFADAHSRAGAARLTEATQRLIDRLVFMRICEDRDIIPFGRLRGTVEEAIEHRQDLAQILAGRFREFDATYNGYLFKAHFSEQLAVPAQALADFIRSLYPPEAPYRFDIIGDDLLGTVYERFLGSTITVTGNRVEADEKPEVRHAGGVYYTPRFVVESIIRRVLGPKLEGRAPLDVLDLKILDPACGSGSFLIAAYQHLMDHCLRHIERHPQDADAPASPRARKRTRRLAFQDAEGIWRLTPDFKAEILTSCLHGVDIDAQAAEVTIMSLYIKTLEGRLPDNWQRELLADRLLPPLDNNIRCGNSLLSPEDFDRYWEQTHGGLFPADPDVRFRMNPFDWSSPTRGFGRVLESRGGFDCIIGNPPYIRVQELRQWAPPECEFYKWRYRSASRGNYDIYAPFIERSLELLSPDGLLGFICPHKFWQASYGAELRRLLADGRHLRSVIDFGDQQVFRGASTYTAIQVFGKSPNRKRVDYAHVNELTDGELQCRAIDSGQPADGVVRFRADHPDSGAPWRFESSDQIRHKAAIDAATTVRLGDIAARMFQGIRTSMNEVFVLGCENPAAGRYRSKLLARSVELEPDLLKPFLGGEDIRRYELCPVSTAVLIPYRIGPDSGGDLTLLAPETLADRYPKTWAYLKSCETELRGRERGRMDCDGWYGYVYPKNLDVFGAPRIVVRDIIDRASFALDPKGQHAFVSGYGITLKPQYASLLPYLLGLLNSQLLDDYLKTISTPLRGGWFRPFPQFLRHLPIKLPDTAEGQKVAEEISERVHQVVEAKFRLQTSSLSDRERDRLGADTEAHERRINQLVCRIYSLDRTS